MSFCFINIFFIFLNFFWTHNTLKFWFHICNIYIYIRAWNVDFLSFVFLKAAWLCNVHKYLHPILFPSNLDLISTLKPKFQKIVGWPKNISHFFDLKNMISTHAKVFFFGERNVHNSPYFKKQNLLNHQISTMSR